MGYNFQKVEERKKEEGKEKEKKKLNRDFIC